MEDDEEIKMAPPAWLMTAEQQGEAILVYEARSLGGRYWYWLRLISTNAGDEDRIAFVPASQATTYEHWLDEGGRFGGFTVEEHKMTDGRLVLIGCHG